MIHVVLFQPEIPHNTGAVGRLCLATGARLHLIRPLGFSLEDRYLRRAGLDYWAEVDVHEWDSWEQFRDQSGDRIELYYLTTKATRCFWDEPLGSHAEVGLVFGPETRGLPESMIQTAGDRCLRIPMEGTRSLNLSTAAGITLYEVLRQRRVAAAAGRA